MARLNNAPTPQQFANAWTRGFAKAVRDAAGRDGRLSKNEASKIEGVYGDNAVNYLEAKGQKSVSVDKLIGKGHDYAFAVAARVAGPGNRVSLEEGRSLPDDLRADFFALRGKEAPSAKLTGAALTQALESAATTPDGRVIEYISEGDYPVLAVEGDNPTGKIDDKSVLRAFEDVLLDGIFADVEDYSTGLAGEVWTKKQSADFLKDLATPWDGMDDYYTEMMVGFRNIKSVMEENLSDVRVVKVGAQDDAGAMEEYGTFAYFIVGKTDDGKMAGVYFGSAET